VVVINHELIYFLGVEQDGEIVSIQPNYVVVIFYQNGAKIRKNVQINLLRRSSTRVYNYNQTNIFCNFKVYFFFFFGIILFFLPFVCHFVYYYKRPVMVNVTVSD